MRFGIAAGGSRSRSRRSVLIGLVAVALVLAGAWCVRRLPPARSFIPGPLGREPGLRAVGPGENAFVTRAMFGVDRHDGGNWQRQNGLNSRVAFSHNLARVFPPVLYEQHPEYFPLVGGRRLRPPERAEFWNPDLGRADVASHAAQAARDYFSEHPRAETYSIGINDGLIFGESAETREFVTPVRWFRERPDYSNLVFTFANRTAEELGRTHRGKRLGALAYYWAENAPDFPLHPGVLPFLTADRSQAYDEKFKVEEAALQRRWVEAAKSHPTTKDPIRLGIYDYLYGRGFLIPRIHINEIAENLRNARRTGFSDYFAEVEPNWGLDGPQPWVVAQLLLDPEQPVAHLLDEYYSRYFKKAAAPMRTFFSRCEQQWMRQPGAPYWLKHFRNESQAALFPAAVCAELRALLIEAERHAAGSPRVLDRVRLVSDTFAVTERFVAFQESRDALNRAVLRRSTEEVIAAHLETFIAARAAFLERNQQVRAQQPLALATIDLTDYTKHDPVPAALIMLGSLRPGQAQQRLQPMADRLPDDWRRLLEPSTSWNDMCRNGELQGTPIASRQIAELAYEADLPSEWLSRVEPAEHFRATIVRDGDGARALRIVGSKDASISQWNAARPGRWYIAEASVRGHVSPGCSVALTLGWLDASHRNVGFVTTRLPEGTWPDAATLLQAGTPPASAVWIGVGVRVQNQTSGDWVEVTDFKLRESP